MDALELARVQFAANISFHILFPTITLALAWVLCGFKLLYHRTAQTYWLEAYRFWVKIFALSFALGVVSGVTMSFQFGTNWPGFMNTVGNIAGPLLAYEVLSAFFLEATFLGIMLFGRSRVPEWLHTTATMMVAVGTSLSAFWILSLNSWMHTPQGFSMIDGVAMADDWWAIVFNPSFAYRFSHVFLASILTCSFLIAGLSAYRMRLGDRSRSNDVVLRFAVVLAAIITPVQIFVGDLHGLNTFEHQPAKIAAIEAIWDDTRCAPLLLFAWPDESARRNKLGLGIPCGASWILTHQADGEIRGLNSFVDAHPPVLPLFWGFRLMVGVGMAMLLISHWSAWRLLRGKGLGRILSAALVAMTFSGWLATLAGWYVTEIGRQPYLVYGVLRTADAVQPLPLSKIGTSLALYLALYSSLIVAFISTVFLMARRAVDPSTSAPTAIVEGAR